MNSQKPFSLSVDSCKVTQTLVNREIFQPLALLLTIHWKRQLDRSWKYCVQFVKSFQLWRMAGEGEKRLKMSGSRPRWLATRRLSKLSDSAVDGGFLWSWREDELQQIVWNIRDFLSCWLIGGLRDKIIPWQVQNEWNPRWGKSHIRLDMRFHHLHHRWGFFWKWASCVF